ncbi:MAG: radical SAM protein [Alphaproteobacteria bacterium]|nr:radical SAM protein [Alphaproteobacteria bacterium]
MSVLTGGPEAFDGVHVPRLDFELTPACDHACGHCYNVWTAKEGDPQAGFETRGQLSTRRLKQMMTKAVRESGARHLTITGGEPLLRADALEILEHACGLVPSVSLITNGSHVREDTAARFKAMGLRSVQLTLLAGERALHDRLKGAVCFDDTVRAALRLRKAGVHVQVCFVAMSQNAGELARVMELCLVLGVGALSYNRMSPTGGAIHNIEDLMPDAAQIEADLQVADTLGARWDIQVATAMPIMPCLVRTERYRHVRFGYCSTGSHSPNLVIDGKGDVRSCNLSAGVLGNVLQQDWAEIMANPYPRAFRATVPEMCRGCAYERSCQGGCKESGFARYGDITHPEPLLARSVRA